MQRVYKSIDSTNDVQSNSMHFHFWAKLYEGEYSRSQAFPTMCHIRDFV